MLREGYESNIKHKFLVFSETSFISLYPDSRGLYDRILERRLGSENVTLYLVGQK